MSVPTKQVPWSMFVGGLLVKLLKELFCSAAWLKSCVSKVAAANGDRALIDVSGYPPGGKKETGMVHCSNCRRWAPRDGMEPLSTPLCLDCLVERDVDAFTQRLEAIGDPTLVRELSLLYGRHVPSGIQMIQSDRYCSDLWEGYDLNSGRHEVEYRMLGLEFWDAYDRHHRWVGKDTTPTALPGSLLQDIETPDSGRRFARRSLGCQTVLLSEDEASLRQEIADYLRTHTLRPSVTRTGGVNPFQFTPYPKQQCRFETETLGTHLFHWVAR
jgi:hypothetical protein